MDADAQYLIVYQTSSSATSGVALKNDKESLNVTISSGNATPSSDASTALWTYKEEKGWFATSYYLINGSNYLYPSRSGRWNNYTYSLNIDLTQTSVTISNQGSGAYSISNSNSNAYVAYSNNAWGAQSNSQNNIYFYKYTKGTENWKVNPALQEFRITALTVNNDGYTEESWAAYEAALTAATAKLNEVKNANYSSEAAANTALGDLIDLVGALETAYNNLKKAVTITINYQTEDGMTVKTETRKVAEGTAMITLSNVTGTDGKTYVPDRDTLTLVSDQTEYTVIVTEMPFDPSTVTPLEIEYWITNGRPTDDSGNTSYSVSAADAYSEAGVDISTLLPVNTTKETRTLQYWRSRLLNTTLSNSSTSGTEKQTEDAGDDETYNGVEFTKVRYWGGKWEVYTENNGWVTVTSDHQLVAYYLEILPVSDELRVTAADWGKKGDGSTSGDYLDPNSSCTVSVQVVYEDGTTNPATTTAADLASTTIAYGYWSSGRGIGTLNLAGLDGYQIWKIEAETGAETCDAYNSSTWGGYTVSSFTWDNNAMTVYEGDPVDSYIIHNDAHDPSNDGYYANLMWDENYEAILIKVYVKAPVTEDSLTVHYVNRTANDAEFYSYNISVKSDTVFDEKFALNENYTDIDNALTGNTVTNILNVTQTVTANLGKMPEIGAQYRYSDYTCVEVVRSKDGKDVYLYYTFNNAHSFVIDFGLPVKITVDDLKISGNWTSASVTGAQYGTATAANDGSVIYTPTEVLKGVETLQLTLTDSTGSVTHQIYIYPASNVLYEETFLTAEQKSNTYVDWTTSTPATMQQSSAQNTLYGYDDAYETSTGNSMNSAYTATLPEAGKTTENLRVSLGNQATGFDLIGTCGPDTGNVYVMLKNTQTGKVILVDTRYNDQTYDSDSTLHQVPLAHAEFAKDAYNQAIIFGMYNSKNSTGVKQKVEVDGFRVYYDSNNSAYQDAEKNVTYENVLEMVNGDTLAAYIEGKADGTYEKSKYESKGGPQNEIYLAPGQSVAFNVGSAGNVQISARAVSDDRPVSMTDSTTSRTITSNTEMYYEVAATKGLVTITNNSSTDSDTLLALGNIKLPSGAQTVALTEANLRTVYAMLSAASAPQVFTPDKIDINVRSTKVIRNKVVTLTVTTSTDVSYLLVNNKKVTPANKRLVDWGIADEYVFVVSDVVNRNTDMEYAIYAYDQNSTVSALYTAKG